jgi:hypothetical protein
MWENSVTSKNPVENSVHYEMKYAIYNLVSYSILPGAHIVTAWSIGRLLSNESEMVIDRFMQNKWTDYGHKRIKLKRQKHVL